MPVSIQDMELDLSLHIDGPVNWGQLIPCENPGVYLIAISSIKDLCSTIVQPPIDKDQTEQWIINTYRRILLSGQKPRTIELLQFVSSFWLPNETILYIGCTNKRTIARRVNDFYGHRIGHSRPHYGGQWLLLLSCLKDLQIYWIDWKSLKESQRQRCWITPKDLEEELLVHFSSSVGKGSPILPFANLKSDRLKIHSKCNSLTRKAL